MESLFIQLSDDEYISFLDWFSGPGSLIYFKYIKINKNINFYCNTISQYYYFYSFFIIIILKQKNVPS